MQAPEAGAVEPHKLSSTRPVASVQRLVAYCNHVCVHNKVNFLSRASGKFGIRVNFSCFAPVHSNSIFTAPKPRMTNTETQTTATEGCAELVKNWRLLSLDGLGDIFVHIVSLAVAVDAHENALVGVSERLQVLVVGGYADFDLKRKS